MFMTLKMTDKQRGTFAEKLAQMVSYLVMPKLGEDYQKFAARIETELLDESKQVFYLPYLQKLGFQQS